MAKAKAPPVRQKGEPLAHIGPWIVTCNEPGYTMLLQYGADGRQRFLTHRNAAALAAALLEALRHDPESVPTPPPRQPG